MGCPEGGVWGLGSGLGSGVLWVVGIWGIGSAATILALGIVVLALGLWPCVVGDGFHALHGNMLSWLDFARWIWILRVLRQRSVVRGVRGRLMLSLAREGVAWFVGGGSLCGVVSLR